MYNNKFLDTLSLLHKTSTQTVPIKGKSTLMSFVGGYSTTSTTHQILSLIA